MKKCYECGQPELDHRAEKHSFVQNGRKLTKLQLINKLLELTTMPDIEKRHLAIDQALLDAIHDKEVTRMYYATKMWYS